MPKFKKYTTADLTLAGIEPPINDPLFNVALISKTESPNMVAYAAMHQDYSAEQVDELPDAMTEDDYGKIIVKKLLAGKRGHFGPLEGNSITFNCGYFPHSTMQQARTHRVGISFDVQSFRYTSESILAAASVSPSDKLTEECCYLRPAGHYTDRSGKKYEYTQQLRGLDLIRCWWAALEYKEKFISGFSEEHARGVFPFDYRQHFVVSFNMRSLMHFMDLRGNLNAAPEIRALAELLGLHFKDWSPEVYDWYVKARFRKAVPAP